ncbi:MAG TPA: hypothetical protein PLA52_01310 [Candidatus Omnitrophota bacterium]|nr:hypothetical protein [Candidatus Omnitrophota bacterium]
MQKAAYLKFWVMPVGGYEISRIIGEEIGSFEKLHSRIRVDCSVIPWSLAWKKTVTASGEEGGPGKACLFAYDNR